MRAGTPHHPDAGPILEDSAMQRIPRRLVFLVAGLIGLVIAAPLALAADDAATIRAGTEAWIKAYNSGNVDAIVNSYAADAIVMPPGAPAAKGHAAIKAFATKDVAGAKAAGVTLVLTTPNEVGVKGDMAWHAGQYVVKDKAGATVDSGSYMEVWHKKAGKWLISRDIWNSSTPPAPPPAPAAAPAPAPKK